MSYLEKLLQGAEVEWKSLGEVGLFVRGSGLQKKDFTNAGVGCIHYGQIYTHYNTYVYNTKSFVSEEFARKARMAKQGDLIIATTSENDDDVCKAVVWLGEQDIAISNDACFYTHDLEPKYVAYFFQTEEFQRNKRRFITGTKVRRVNVDDLAKILIPVPPTSAQKEIVRILDTFTELTKELTTELAAELTARKKQYEYYREQLLSFDRGEDGQHMMGGGNTIGGLPGSRRFDRYVKWKTLGEVAYIGTGSRNTNEAIPNGKFPFFVRSQEARTIDQYEFDEVAIITAGDGVGVGKVFHFVSGKYALHQRAYRIVVSNDQVISKFLFHYIRNTFAKYLETVSVHASVTSLRKPMFEKFPVPIPSLEEQARVVSILDKFDTLTTSITEGLPKEIALRKAQYEYYRELLLTFPKPAN